MTILIMRAHSRRSCGNAHVDRHSGRQLDQHPEARGALQSEPAALGVTLPGSLGWALVAGARLVTAMYAVGLLIAATAPTVNAGPALGLGAFFLMLALGGGFGSVERPPDVLRQAGELLPYGAGNSALSAAWIGEVPALQDLSVLGAWTVVAGG